MKNKKNEKYDLGSLRWLVYTIGLVIALGTVVLTFESFGYYVEEAFEDDEEEEEEEEVLEEIPRTEVIPPPPPPVPQQPEIIEVPDEKEIEEIEDVIDAELDENTTPPPVTSTGPPENVSVKVIPQRKKKKKTNDIFMMAEEQPQFEGGRKKFLKYLKKNLKYPPQARRMNIEGKVYVEFVVNKDGSLVDIKVLKGIGGGCDEEALRVLKKSPKWKPGLQRGNPVRVRMSVPIVFRLR